MEEFGVGAGEAQRALKDVCELGVAEKVRHGRYRRISGGINPPPSDGSLQPGASYPARGYDFTSEQFRAFCGAHGTTLEGVARSLGIRGRDLRAMRKAVRLDFTNDPFGRGIVDQLRARRHDCIGSAP